MASPHDDRPTTGPHAVPPVTSPLMTAGGLETVPEPTRLPDSTSVPQAGITPVAAPAPQVELAPTPVAPTPVAPTPVAPTSAPPTPDPGARRGAGDAAGGDTGPAPAPAHAKPRDNSTVRSALRLISLHIRPLRLKMSFGLVLLVAAALIGLGQPLATRLVLDTVGAQRPLGNAVLILVALVLGAALTQGFGQYLMLLSAEDVVLSSRRRLIDRILGLSVSGMRSQGPGDLMARVTSDTALIRQIAMSSLVQFVTGVVVIVGALVIMALLDALLLMITLGVVGIFGLCLALIMPRIRQASIETQKNVGAMGSELERVLGSYTTVKAAGAEDDESERLGQKARRTHGSGVRAARWNSIAGSTSAMAVQAAFLVVLAVGGWRVQTGALDVSSLIAFLLYAMQLSSPVVQLTSSVSSFQAGRAALERIAEVDEVQREASPDCDETPTCEFVPGSLASLGPVSWEPAATFESVSMTYPGQDAPAVRDFSLRIPGTGITAIVGPSGCGKSSVLKIIEGFYPLGRGTVQVAGRSLAEWDLNELRQQVAYVEQETPVMAGSLRENLCYGVDGITDEELMAAVDRVGLGERIPSLDATEAEVGHRGNSLSGGERQRIALARALLREPRMLLLDEATSQLDARTEAAMRDLVAGVARTTPVVVVAHRLSTVIDAAQIVVMQEGRVRAVGDHEALMAEDTLYRGMIEEQNL